MQKTYLSISKWMKLDKDGRGENEADEKHIPISIPVSSGPRPLVGPYSIIQRACDKFLFAVVGRGSAD